MQTDVTIIAKTLYGEARGEGENGLRAVATVIWNRANHIPAHLTQVCLKPKQFSCWNGTGITIKEPVIYEICKDIANEMISELFESYPFKLIQPTNYITVKLYNSNKCPSWAKNQKGEIVGNHIFFELQYW